MDSKQKPSARQIIGMNKLVYDCVLWFFDVILDLFFREIHPRSSWRIPRKGPVLFVCAPHANQVFLSRTFRMPQLLTVFVVK
jgi:glycerol-3-phosphate O-acyltransferase/dihydroxyacetone phosphate acyltransferase